MTATGVSRPKAALLCCAALLACHPVAAQLGPIDTGGYAEYRFDHIAGRKSDSPVAHRLAVRTDFATYVWRPWILTASGGINVVYGNADSGSSTRESTSLGGNLRLNFVPRSRFPLSIYFMDTDENSEAAAVRASGATRQYGFTQQLHTERLGRYSLDWQAGESSSFSETSIFVSRNRNYERLQFTADKSAGAHRFGITSRYLDLTSDTPNSTTESLRHTLRHNFRSSKNLTWRNDAFLNDEIQTNEVFSSDRRYYQFNSMLTWIPETRRRVLVTGRGLFQGSDSLTPLSEFGQQTASLSANANYYLTDRLTVSGGVGAILGMSDDRGDTSSHFQQLSTSYRSTSGRLWGGAYTYRGNAVLANRFDDNATQSTERQFIVSTVGHGLKKRLNISRLGQVQIQLSQDVGTSMDTLGRERNQLRHSLHLTTGSSGESVERFVRFSLTDQRTFGDERRINQLANLQLSLRGRPDSNRQWTGNISLQYGKNRLREPLALASAAESLGYSVNLDYRHAELWGVS